jgi:hypothetical protein
MTTDIMIPFDEFVEYFLDGDTEKAKQYEPFKDDDSIILFIKNDDTETNGVMCCFYWRTDETHKYKKIRYNSSSPFAFWMCQYQPEEDEEE